MNPKEEILNRLLDKYEKSKHLTEPGVSNRRVYLQIFEKKTGNRKTKDLPGYRY